MATNNAKGLSMSDRIALLGIKNVLTLDDLVLYTGYARATLKSLTSRGNIPSYKPAFMRGTAGLNNAKSFYKKAEIDEWLTSVLPASYDGVEVKPLPSSPKKATSEETEEEISGITDEGLDEVTQEELADDLSEVEGIEECE